MKFFSKQLGVLVLSIFYVFVFLGYGSEEIVTANNDELLRLCEKGDKKYIKLEIGEQIVYYHQRMIGEALVEKDFTVYQFSKHTKELIKKIENRRSDLPEKTRTVMTVKEAAALVEGNVLHTMLIIISPQSDVFPIIPTPENPCWVVKHEKDGEIILTVIDAVEGEVLGLGISPPGQSFAYSGPCYSNPCRDVWGRFLFNAYQWFKQFGASVQMNWPRKTTIQAYVQNPQTMLIYQFGHGSYTSFANSCLNGVSYEFVYSEDVRLWMKYAPPKLFVFLGHCDGMCDTGIGSFSYEYRKGGNQGTTTIGYCGMSENQCSNCWPNALVWQKSMFRYIFFYGYSVKQAFYQATADFPMCNGCVRFAGDPNLVLKAKETN